MKLGIIGAMDVEVATLKAKMENISTREIAGSAYFEGILEGTPAVVVQCGVGKVNAALCAQILCDVYGATHLINTGIAGSLDAKLEPAFTIFPIPCSFILNRSSSLSKSNASSS